MSDTEPAINPARAETAIERLETKIVAAMVTIARDPDETRMDGIRAPMDGLDAETVLRLSDRAATVLERQASRTGNYDILDRALPYLPGQGIMERDALVREAKEPAAPQLSPDARTVQAAIDRVLDERQPDAPYLKAHAVAALTERERVDGPVTLTPDMRRSIADAPGPGIPPIPVPTPPPPPPPALDEPTVTLTRRGDNAPLPSPDAAPTAPQPRDTLGGYVVRQVGAEKHYFQVDDGQLAMRTDEQRIHGVLRDQRTIGATLDLAAARGWNEVQIRGDADIARQTWVEATSRGMVAEGYQPMRADLHAVQQRIVERREQGLPVGEVTPQMQRAAERVEQTPERAPGQETRDHNRAVMDRIRGSESQRGWTTREGGYDALPPQERSSAERSYAAWAERNPELGAKHGLADYVEFVQDRQAEERQRLAMPPPKVETPRHAMRM